MPPIVNVGICFEKKSCFSVIQQSEAKEQTMASHSDFKQRYRHILDSLDLLKTDQKTRGSQHMLNSDFTVRLEGRLNRFLASALGVLSCFVGKVRAGGTFRFSG